MTSVNKTDNENNLQTGYETNPLLANRKAEIAELQKKSDAAKSVYQKAKEKFLSISSLRDTIKANSIWAYNRGQQVDESALGKYEGLVADAKSQRDLADAYDTSARTTLFCALT